MDDLKQATTTVVEEAEAHELEGEALDAVTGAGGPVFPPCITGSTSPYCKP
jgi:hypothetical protein